MKHKQLCTLGLIVLGCSVFAAVHADAFTEAGTHYANPSLDQTIFGSSRFIVLTNMSNQAVLDKETGLVWEKSPSTDQKTWEEAQIHCNGLKTGNRMGWRLPTLQELASLVDPAVHRPGPTLPSGHPFSGVQSSTYWSATTYAGLTTSAWCVHFDDNNDDGSVSTGGKARRGYVWCVRGGRGVDPQ